MVHIKRSLLLLETSTDVRTGQHFRVICAKYRTVIPDIKATVMMGNRNVHQ